MTQAETGKPRTCSTTAASFTFAGFRIGTGNGVAAEPHHPAGKCGAGRQAATARTNRPRTGEIGQRTEHDDDDFVRRFADQIDEHFIGGRRFVPLGHREIHAAPEIQEIVVVVVRGSDLLDFVLLRQDLFDLPRQRLDGRDEPAAFLP